jgi:hypothetical protein
VQNEPSDNIDLEQLREALARSGYLLESRLEAHLRRLEFRVELNGLFPDPESGKGRELDIHASYSRCWPTGPDDTDNLSFEIVAECINPPQPIAFVTRRWPDSLFEVGNRWDALKVGGDPLHVPESELATNWSWLASTLKMERYHHYSSKRFATQYCSFERKRGSSTWMAKHRDEDHHTFRKLCDATSYYQRQLFSRRGVQDIDQDLFLTFLYPVLVVQGDLYEVRGDSKTLDILKTPHVQYRCTQLYSGRSEDFQIDVVTEDHFPEYLKLLYSDTEKTVSRMRRRHREVRDLLRTRDENERKFGAKARTPLHGAPVF